MAALIDATLAAGASSAEISVTPLAPLAFNASAPCQVMAKSRGAWGVLYVAAAHHDRRIIYPTSGTIKVVAGSVATDVELLDG